MLDLNQEQQFGALIHNLRIKQEMTQSELGEGIYSPTLISRIEQGKFLPNRLIPPDRQPSEHLQPAGTPERY